MNKILTIFFLLIINIAKTQTIEEINNFRDNTLENLERYECLQYSTEEILNEDAMRYDTARFYVNSDGELIYINWLTRGHYFHIMGDVISYNQMILINNKVVYYRRWGFSFENPQWHLEDNLNETKVEVSESNREYYTFDGKALMSYQTRETKGVFKDRFTSIDSVPLKEQRRLIWSNRCDECIERDYLSVYRELVEKKKE